MITLEEFKHAMMKSTDMDDHKVQDAACFATFFFVEMEEMFASCDINGDHVIKYKELVTALTHEHIRANDERLHEAFSELDVDDDGTISPKDLTQIMNVPFSQELLFEFFLVRITNCPQKSKLLSIF